MISVERLEKLSNDLSFEAATIERVVRLIDVLERLTKDREIGHLFALKGGTALNLFYLGLDRLSVDIDFNYIGAEDRETMLVHKALIEQRLPRLMQSYGYELIRLPRSEHAGEKWRFKYVSAHQRPGTIEVDVNYMYRSPFFGTAKMDSAPLGGTPRRKSPSSTFEKSPPARSSRWPRATHPGISTTHGACCMRTPWIGSRSSSLRSQSVRPRETWTGGRPRLTATATT
jgi:hypothetical protein